MTYTDIISTIGVSLILLAFFLNTFKYISDTRKLYFILNMVGGAFTVSMFSDLTRMVTMQNLYHDGGYSNTGISSELLEKIQG